MFVGPQFIDRLPAGDEVVQDGGPRVAHRRIVITMSESFSANVYGSTTFNEQKRHPRVVSQTLRRLAMSTGAERCVDHHRSQRLQYGARTPEDLLPSFAIEERNRDFMLESAVISTKRSHCFCIGPSAPMLLMVSRPPRASTRSACFCAASRKVRLTMEESGN